MKNLRITHPDAETTRIQIPLADSRAPAALGAALDVLLGATRNLAALIRNPPELADDSKTSWYLVTTFHTPRHTFLRERLFFARCARHPELHDKMLAYARSVDAKARGVKISEGSLGHSDMRRAGCFAVVPLVLRDPHHVDALIEHMRGYDMDHETHETALIEELLRRHGLREETLRLLAFRAVDATGQDGLSNLRLAYAKHGLRERLEAPGGVAAFAELVDRTCQRVNYRPLYVANAGAALFQRDPARFAEWLAWFEARGLAFGPSDRTLRGEPRDPKAPDFLEEWRSED